jgi:CHASE3 domain sensor protein
MDRLKLPHVPVPTWVGVLFICFCMGWMVFVGLTVVNLKSFVRHTVTSTQTRVLQEQVFSDIKDAESGQRGYLLTQDKQYLAQYIAGARSVRLDVRTLRQYIVQSPREIALFNQVSPIVDAKLDELEATVKAFDSAGLPAAVAIVKTNRGLLLMTQIRDVFDTMRAVERDEIRKQNGGIF